MEPRLKTQVFKYCINIYRQHCAQRNTQVLIYSEANFEVFRSAGATRCTSGGEMCPAKFVPVPNFIPIRATVRV